MAAVPSGSERIDGLSATDVVELLAGDGSFVKTATVGEVMGYGWVVQTQ